jgi:GNAT superfamily N-acetyltransferase
MRPLEVALASARVAAPAGVAIRAWREPADFARIAAIHAAAGAVDGAPRLLSVAGLEASVNVTGRPAGTAIMMAEADGQTVGWVWPLDDGETSDGERTLVHRGQVAPAWRGRGIGRALLIAAQAHLTEVVRQKPSAGGMPVGFESETMSTGTATIRLLRHDGYRPVRSTYAMVRTLRDDPMPIDVPAGIEVRPVDPQDLLRVGRGLSEASQDQRGWPSFTDEQLVAFLQGPRRGQSDLWQICWEGDEIVGGVLGSIDVEENLAFGRRRGYLEEIFTRRPWRGRGIAGTLIALALRSLHERGMTEAALWVDTENPTGALRLYQRHGFQTSDQLIAFRRDLQRATGTVDVARG